ncbi:MAG: tetratricopeptide repeat protein [Methanospirillaceae archaeon]|nr:tetratricopeptide repeat protein [Methanospirillaceae archaeon]
MKPYQLTIVLILAIAGFFFVFISSAEEDWYSRGLFAYENGSYSEALEYLNVSLKQNPNDTWVHYQIGETYWALQSPAAALVSYQKSAGIDEKNTWAWYGIGKASALLGYQERAEDAYRNAVSTDPANSWAWIGLGDIARKKGQYSSAGWAYESAVQADPKNPVAWKKKGQYHDELRQYGPAIASYQKVTLLSPDDFWGWFLLGSALRDTGMYTLSQGVFTRAYQQDPGLFTETIEGWGTITGLTGNATVISKMK